MKINVSFDESKQTFSADFGVVHNASDGGYDRGYAEGYKDGVASVDTESGVNALVDGSVTEIESSADIIRSSAFRDLAKLKTASFPNVITVNGYAFNGCKSLESLYLPLAKTFSMYAAQNCTKLTEISLPSATALGLTCFSGCTAMKSAYLPKVTAIANSAFNGCTVLSEIYAPLVTKIENTAFQSCSLAKADFPLVTSVGNLCFRHCASLIALVLRKNQVCALGNVNSFEGTPVASGTGYIYVPAALVDSYKAATNWKTYAAQFRALEDYTVDGTITGELDETKV